MKIRDWSQRIQWVVVSIVSVGLLIFISTAYSKRTQPSLAIEPVQDLQQRVTSLEQRVDTMQKEINAMRKALSEKQDAKRERPPGGWDKN